jgi:hypothetical protein
VAAGATYTPISSQTLGTAAATVTFSSIPSTYTDLILIISATASSSSDNGQDIQATFNSDTGSNYSWTQVYGTGSAAGSNRGSNQTYMKFGLANNAYPPVGIVHINNYANSTTYKTSLVRRDDAGYYPVAVVNLWRSTSAITSISLKYASAINFIAGSQFTLYGVTAA